MTDRPTIHPQHAEPVQCGHDLSTPSAHLVTDLLDPQAAMACTYVLDTSVLLADPAVAVPLRRARGRAPPRRAHRARGQARSSRARLGGPAEPARCSRTSAARYGSLVRSMPITAARGHVPRRDQPHGHNRAAGRADLRQQRPPHPRGGQEPRQRSAPRRGRDQGPPAAAEGEHRRASKPRSTATSSPATRPGPASPSSTSRAR